MHELIHLTRGGEDAGDEALPGLPTEARRYRRLERGQVVGEASFDWGQGLTRRLSAKLTRSPESALEEVGPGLWRFLQETGWEARRDLFEGLSRGEEALLTVRPDAEELLHLPWEACWTDKHGMPIHEHREALIRYERAGLPELEEPGRPASPGVLFAWSAQVPAPTVQAHREALQASCEAGGLTFRELESADLDALHDALDEGGFSVLHLLAHGLPGDANTPPTLHLGEESALTPRSLRRLLRARDELRLLVLMACHSGAADAASLRFGGLAEAAQEAGLPAVIASRWLLSQPSSVRVTQLLYKEMAQEGRSLERALAKARDALLKVNKLADVFTLQLLARSEHVLRMPDGGRARREVVASYPFGDSEQPTPSKAGERLRAELVLNLDLDTLSAEDEAALLARLEARARARVRTEARLAGSVRLFIDISRDGLQRLFLDHRAGTLSEHLGAEVLSLQAWPGPIPAPAGGSGGGGGEEPVDPPKPRWPLALGGAVLLLLGGLLAWKALSPGPVGPPGCVAEAELCDGEDNDCDERVDEEASDARVFFVDADGDGVGGEASQRACEAPEGFVTQDGDCDDADAGVNPEAEELCDQVDNDCDQRVDEDATTLASWYLDRDGDGHGAGAVKRACERPGGYVRGDEDCDDGDPARHPGATEACDQVDNDCDDEVDEGAEPGTWYADRDRDGVGGEVSQEACAQPQGYVAANGDCDDADRSRTPGATEVCDQVDNDCDDRVDEGMETRKWYADRDQDGYGGEVVQASCAQPRGYVEARGDCDDADPARHRGRRSCRTASTTTATGRWTRAATP
ncbi:MAG: CHAT domain-containing protein [Alphaproteobacteria bacterium]|nr:CHAT domain-containing protein [Alphaproteobacteria bacterium]